MSSHSRILEWTAMIRTHPPAFEQAPVDGVGLVELGHGAGALLCLDGGGSVPRPAVATPGNRPCGNSCASGAMRPRLNGATNGKPPSTPQACFVPLLQWIVGQWQGTQTGPGPRCHHLGHPFYGVGHQRVVYCGRAMPVAWTILAAQPAPCLAPLTVRWLLRTLRPAIPTGWTVIVLADRGLYAGWLVRRIVRLGWHPFLRITAGGTFRPTGHGRFSPLATFAPHVGACWRGTGTAFKRAPRQLPCTLLACWEEGYTAPWLILTDLPPEASDACWYGLRAWIEQGFKVTKRAGWQWQRTRMTEPQQAARLWLAVAVATLWLLSVGGMADAAIPDSTLLDVSAALRVQRRQRRVNRPALGQCLSPGLDPDPGGAARPRALAPGDVYSRALAYGFFDRCHQYCPRLRSP